LAVRIAVTPDSCAERKRRRPACGQTLLLSGIAPVLVAEKVIKLVAEHAAHEDSQACADKERTRLMEQARYSRFEVGYRAMDWDHGCPFAGAGQVGRARLRGRD